MVEKLGIRVAFLAILVLPAAAAGPAADNSRCQVCHINFKQDDLTLRHQKANIGCVRCHGDSSEHASDEDNITAPDIMYAKRAVNPFCMKCHAGTHTAAAKKQCCTDCHGKHRAPQRTRRWDPESHKLADR